MTSFRAAIIHIIVQLRPTYGSLDLGNPTSCPGPVNRFGYFSVVTGASYDEQYTYTYTSNTQNHSPDTSPAALIKMR